MISKLIDGGSGDVLVLALSGTVAVLVAKGPGRASFGRVLSGVLSNPVPVRKTSTLHSPTDARQRAAA